MAQRFRLASRPGWVAALGLACVVAGVVPAIAQSYWFENYERAVALIDAGEMGPASALLDTVIKDHPIPVACLKVPGDRCIDYIPYFHRARIQLYRGDTRAAAHSLDVFEAFGAGLQTRKTEKRMLQMRQQIEDMEASRRPERSESVAPAVDQH